ncbi:MAG: GTP-binding protein [Actinomycetota bacterium]|nr:GTP-binding protein [Actinomycetota bacterium]
MALLRIATAGSVDDGKSTLIGRLLYDAKAVFADQLDAVEKTSADRGDEHVDLSLFTDGLRAEREQGITIDVAYRYFATPARTFILADTPGHVQYTRNMVTGASTADVALILVDARKGLVEQSRRHAVLAALLRVPHLVLLVNKLDLVDYDQSVFDATATDFRDFATRLGVPDVAAIPISALVGDNVVDRSDRTPWYAGPPLLEWLETVPIDVTAGLDAVRFPVQYVVRPRSADHPDYRGYAGQLAAGVLRQGDEVVVLPSGRRTTVAGIDTADGPVDVAVPPMSVTVRLTDEIDVSRGDLFCSPTDVPAQRRRLDATVCWMSETPLRAGARYSVKHTTRTVRATVAGLHSRLDPSSLEHSEDASTLELNDIGRLTLATAGPLFPDDYVHSRTTGGFLLIDEDSGATAGAGFMTSIGDPR